MDEYQRKSFRMTMKADGAGTFRAVFATLNVIDHDGDVTRPGAFKDGAPVIIGSWGHKMAELPIGKGIIRANDSEAVVEGEFFLGTAAGKDTYETVKALGDLGEWSYVFKVTKQSFGEQDGRPVRFLEGMNVYSVDPVLAGSGIATRTTAIKSLTGDGTFSEHAAEIASDVEAFLSRVKERAEVRQKEGRVFSGASVEKLGAIAESLKAAGASLEELVRTAEPKTATHELELAVLAAQRILAGLPA